MTPDRCQGNLDKESPRRARRYRDNAEMVAFLRRVILAQGRRVAVADAEDLADLLGLADLLDGVIADTVHRLRAEEGFTWATVATATGTSRQAAQQRWGTPRGVKSLTNQQKERA